MGHEQGPDKLAGRVEEQDCGKHKRKDACAKGPIPEHAANEGDTDSEFREDIHHGDGDEVGPGPGFRISEVTGVQVSGGNDHLCGLWWRLAIQGVGRGLVVGGGVVWVDGGAVIERTVGRTLPVYSFGTQKMRVGLFLGWKGDEKALGRKGQVGMGWGGEIDGNEGMYDGKTVKTQYSTTRHS